MTIKEVLKFVKNKIVAIASFLFQLFLWSWQLFAVINMIILYTKADVFIILNANIFLGIFMAKTFMHYLFLTERINHDKEFLRDCIIELSGQITALNNKNKG
jgi:hypothetical protein